MTCKGERKQERRESKEGERNTDPGKEWTRYARVNQRERGGRTSPRGHITGRGERKLKKKGKSVQRNHGVINWEVKQKRTT